LRTSIIEGGRKKLANFDIVYTSNRYEQIYKEL
jgi:hypothetical protein